MTAIPRTSSGPVMDAAAAAGDPGVVVDRHGAARACRVTRRITHRERDRVSAGLLVDPGIAEDRAVDIGIVVAQSAVVPRERDLTVGLRGIESLGGAAVRLDIQVCAEARSELECHGPGTAATSHETTERATRQVAVPPSPGMGKARGAPFDPAGHESP